MHRDAHIPLFGEPGLACLKVGGKVDGVSRLLLGFGDRLVEGAEARCGVGSRQGDVADVGQIQAHAGEGSEPLLVVEIAETQLVHPQLNRLAQHIIPVVGRLLLRVANTDHNGGDIGEVGRTNHRHAISSQHHRVGDGNAGMRAAAYLDVALLLHVDQRVEHNFHAVVDRPNGGGVLTAVPRRQLNWNLILIVVVGEVGAQTDESGHIALVDDILLVNLFGMDEHLKFLELTEVVSGGFVDGARIAVDQVLHLHRQCLLIHIINSGTSKALFAFDTRRQHVRNRRAVAVLLITQTGNVERGFLSTVSRKVVTIFHQVEGIGAPVASHQFECG